MDRLKEVAQEALDSFGSIADAAAKVLQQRGLSLADPMKPDWRIPPAG